MRSSGRIQGPRQKSFSATSRSSCGSRARNTSAEAPCPNLLSDFQPTPDLGRRRGRPSGLPLLPQRAVKLGDLFDVSEESQKLPLFSVAGLRLRPIPIDLITVGEGLGQVQEPLRRVGHCGRAFNAFIS